MKRTFTEKLQMTFGAILMSPMMFDDPKAKKENYWSNLMIVLGMIWSDKEEL